MKPDVRVCQDRREEERRQAAEVGAQIMESFTQTGTPSNTAADSFGDAQEPAGGSNGWPTGQHPSLPSHHSLHDSTALAS